MDNKIAKTKIVKNNHFKLTNHMDKHGQILLTDVDLLGELKGLVDSQSEFYEFYSEYVEKEIGIICPLEGSVNFKYTVLEGSVQEPEKYDWTEIKTSQESIDVTSISYPEYERFEVSADYEGFVTLYGGLVKPNYDFNIQEYHTRLKKMDSAKKWVEKSNKEIEMVTKQKN